MRTLIHRCVAVMFLAIAAAGILAGQTDVEALRAKAKQGDASAQYNLGVMYNNGEGVPQDYMRPLPANAGRSVVLTTARMAGTT